MVCSLYWMVSLSTPAPLRKSGLRMQKARTCLPRLAVQPTESSSPRGGEASGVFIEMKALSNV